MPQIEFRNVQPQEAIRFFGDKLPRESFDWRELWQEEHARQFTVAKSAGRDVLGDIFGAMQDAIAKGQSFDDFKKTLPIARYASVDEMADMALVLVTPLSAYMTGHVVALDGGISLLGGSYTSAYLARKS